MSGHDQTMERIEVGDVIEHRLVPGLQMEVLDVMPCPNDPPLPLLPEPHDSYQVRDPEGQLDWLCAHDVRLVG